MSNSWAIELHMLRQLASYVQQENASATFTCGGSISVADNTEVATHDQTLTKPVTIRWDQASSPSSNGVFSSSKLILPSTNHGALDALLKASEVASFGRNGQDVVDESYRKALKMEVTQFCTDFCPYELGIMDTIAQVLMPSVKGSTNSRGIKAELYKLNVYSGPSGKFKAHIDTPRSDLQFGSLVVCLPFDHEGGQLLVKHGEQTMEYDWSSEAGDKEKAIEWAAFYSDCEHEVCEVTSGHRITLTYNLFFKPGSSVSSSLSTINPSSLPLYGYVKHILTEDNFMPKGGTLGFPCVHAYAHTSEKAFHCLPDSLKGSDMAVFESMKALHLETRLRPVLEKSRYGYYSDENEDQDSDDDAKPGERERVGTDLQEMGTRDGEMEDDVEAIDGAFDHVVENVVWLPQAKKHLETAMAYVAAELEFKYSYAALLVTIPPSSERESLKQL